MVFVGPICARPLLLCTTVPPPPQSMFRRFQSSVPFCPFLPSPQRFVFGFLLFGFQVPHFVGGPDNENYPVLPSSPRWQCLAGFDFFFVRFKDCTTRVFPFPPDPGVYRLTVFPYLPP